ncbi:MAG: phosphatidate cytidylyltransferase [Acidobacteriia bacterium]|nr:phosphatidate cytidylyltransferase [Terriglobia bacterium]
MTRVLSGIVLVLIAVAVVGWAPRWVIFLVLVVLSNLALHEFYQLSEKCGLMPFRSAGHLYALWLLAEQWVFPQHVSMGALTGFVLLVLALSLTDAGSFPRAIGSSGATILGTLYTGGFLSLLLAWPDSSSSSGTIHSPFDSRASIFFLLAVVWASDIGAYYVGRGIGKRKLAPRISPGKTIEGLVGGLIASVLVSLVFHRYWLRGYSLGAVVALAIILDLAGVLGDLAESAMKRGAGVKDSSSIVPGHGGVLDRIDSLLFAIPVMYYYPSLLAFLKSIIKIA